MKKNYYVIAVIFCFFYLHSTQIGVQMVSCIKDIPKEFDVVIIGENEQKILSGSILRDYTIGALYKTKEAEDDVVYLPRTFNYESLEHVYKKNQQIGVTVENDLDCEKIRTITEPVLERELYWCVKEEKEINDCVYQPMRKPSKRMVLESRTFEYCGEKAIEEAKRDLMFCYHKALSCMS